LDDPFELPERTQFSDEGYAVLGRASAFATEFEGSSRALAAILHLKNNRGILDSEKSTSEFFKFLRKNKLYTYIKQIEKDLGLANDAHEVIQRARLARNTLTHEGGLGHDHLMEVESRHSDFVQEVEKLVRDIAEGQLIILVLSQLATREPIPTLDYLNSYVDSVVHWVCKEYFE